MFDYIALIFKKPLLRFVEKKKKVEYSLELHKLNQITAEMNSGLS